MAQWGRNDKSVTVTTSTTKETSTGAPIGTYALVKSGGGDYAHQGNTHGTRANADKNMFGNTTVGAFIPGAAKGIFGVDPTEVGISAGPVVDGVVTFAGSGYRANASVTVTVTNGGTSAVVNAHANSSGRIDALNISTAGSGYITPPTITIDVADVIQFNANSNVTAGAGGGANSTITLGSNASLYAVGDKVTYLVDSGNTAIVGLTAGTQYVVQFANTSRIALATIAAPSTRITLTKGVTEAGHGFRGETATGKVTVGGAKNNGVAHAGWVLRTEGTGGRAGRVQYETLVAMGSLGQTNAKYGTAATTSDASDDTILPDS